MSYVNFEELKQRVSIERVVQMLAIDMKRSGQQLRSMCPHCRAGGDRSLAVNLDGRWYCFPSKNGGDMIGLVAHVRDIGQKEAADAIARHFNIETTPTNSPAPAPQKGLEPLDYLDCLHESVEALGIPIAAADALGAGYASRGTMKGRTLIPLRLPDGTLIGYCGIALDQDPPFLFPDNLEQRAESKVVQMRRKV